MANNLPPSFQTSIASQYPQDACDLGEELRELFFVSSREHDIGYYSTFDFDPRVKQLPDEALNDQDVTDTPYWSCYVFVDPSSKHNGTKFRGFWDGDGVIEFTLPDGRILENWDCKKTYQWEWAKR